MKKQTTILRSIHTLLFKPEQRVIPNRKRRLTSEPLEDRVLLAADISNQFLLQEYLKSDSDAIYGPMKLDDQSYLTPPQDMEVLAAAAVKPKVSIKTIKNIAFEHDEYEDYLAFEITRETTDISSELSVGVKLSGTTTVPKLTALTPGKVYGNNNFMDYSYDAMPNSWLHRTISNNLDPPKLIIPIIPAGQKSVTVYFLINNNGPDKEPDETLTLTIDTSDLGAYTIGTASATGTIKDIGNDALLVISGRDEGYEIGADPIDLPAGVKNTLTYTVTRYGKMGETIKYSFKLEPESTATYGSLVGNDVTLAMDYNQAFVFSEYEKEKLVTFDIYDDTLSEGDETLIFSIKSLSGSNYTVIPENNATGLIHDNDKTSVNGVKSITINIAKVQDGQEALFAEDVKDIIFKVTRTVEKDNQGAIWRSQKVKIQLKHLMNGAATNVYTEVEVNFRPGETETTYTYEVPNAHHLFNQGIQAVVNTTNVNYKVGEGTATAAIHDFIKYADNTLIIYVDTTRPAIAGAPFNQSAVQSLMQQAINSAGIKCQVVLKTKAYNSVPQSSLGFKDTEAEIINPGDDQFLATLKFEEFFGSIGGGLAVNSDHKNITISPKNVENVFTSNPGARGHHDTMYANILLHELLWHGVLEKIGHSGNDGTLGSTSTPWDRLLDLSSWAALINAKFN